VFGVAGLPNHDGGMSMVEVVRQAHHERSSTAVANTGRKRPFVGEPIRVVHYLNQFVGGIGGEERANVPVHLREGPVGPGRALQRHLGDAATVVATIVAGDNHVIEETETASDAMREALREWQPSVVVAGPAFDAGRYGMGCGIVSGLCAELGTPSVTAMHPDNSGIVVHGKGMVVVPTGVDASEMQSILGRVAPLAIKLGSGGELGPADVDGYLPRGYRRLVEREKSGAPRALDMLAAYVHGRPFTTEIPVRAYDDAPDSHYAAKPPIHGRYGTRHFSDIFGYGLQSADSY